MIDAERSYQQRRNHDNKAGMWLVLRLYYVSTMAMQEKSYTKIKSTSLDMIVCCDPLVHRYHTHVFALVVELM